MGRFGWENASYGTVVTSQASFLLLFVVVVVVVVVVDDVVASPVITMKILEAFAD